MKRACQFLLISLPIIYSVSVLAHCCPGACCVNTPPKYTDTYVKKLPHSSTKSTLTAKSSNNKKPVAERIKISG